MRKKTNNKSKEMKKKKKTVLALIIILLLSIIFISFYKFKKRTYYITGELQECFEIKTPFSNIKDGVYKLYEPSGVIIYESNYKNDELDGISFQNYKNGMLKWKAFFKKNKLIQVIEYNDIKGNKLDFGKLINGNGYLKLYRDNGEIEEEGPMKDGFRDGKWIYYTNPDIPILNTYDYYLKGIDQNGFKPPTIHN
jgi:antitoxin component YwqK of YwqJK toxin-antitoxin module